MFVLRKNVSWLLCIALLLGGALVFAAPQADAETYPAWSPTEIYTSGDIVTHNGQLWEAQWWTQGEEPGTTGEWGVWRLVEDDSSGGNGGFYVEGTTLYDATGQPFVMRGVNHAHTWYKDDLSAAIPAIAETGANAVRIVLSDGSRWTRDSVESVQNIISLCEQYQMIAVLEVHDATGSDSTSDLMNAVNYWISIKDALIGNEDTVIVNIANEWYGTWDGAGWAEGYKQAIPALRDAGIKNTLIVDSAGWGQYPASIHNYGQEVYAADSLGNTVFSIHMYEYSGSDADTIKSNIDGVLNQGLPVIIGEFGHRHSDGDVDEATIMSYSQEKGVGWLAWSWYGNSGGVEYLDLADGPSGGLTDWGNTVVNGPNGIRATSQTSGVFSN